MSIRAVYPGTFDPVTNGHIDLIQRSAALFDEVIVAILNNTDKTPLFSIEERVEMLAGVVRDIDNVEHNDLRRSARRLRAADRCVRHRSGYPRRFRLRIRAADGPDEPPPLFSRRDGFSDAGGSLLLPEFSPGKGDLTPRGIGPRSGSPGRGATASVEEKCGDVLDLDQLSPRSPAGQSFRCRAGGAEQGGCFLFRKSPKSHSFSALLEKRSTSVLFPRSVDGVLRWGRLFDPATGAACRRIVAAGLAGHRRPGALGPHGASPAPVRWLVRPPPDRHGGASGAGDRARRHP